MRYVAWIYVACLILGAFVGYFLASSTMSLVAGLSSALLITLALLYAQRHKAGLWVVLILIGALEAFFLWRWLGSGRFFPSGFMTILSTITFIVIALGMTQTPKTSRKH